VPRAYHSFRGAIPSVSVCLYVCDLETPTMRRSRPGWTVTQVLNTGAVTLSVSQQVLLMSLLLSC
jgi:hypothetical protein